MPRTIAETEFVIFDTETTGLDPACGDRVVEIAAIRIKGAQRLAQFHSLINPERSISAAAFAVNQISGQMLENAPRMAQIIPDFLAFISGSVLCAYNAAFDLAFLDHELALAGRGPLDDILVIDVLKMARRLLPGLQRYPLWFVAQHLGFEADQRHRAFADVELTRAVFDRLSQGLSSHGISDEVAFGALFGVRGPCNPESAAEKLATIQEAIDLQMRLKVRYLGSRDATVTERQVIPKSIRQEGPYSYLVGFCCLRNQERTFRVDNIISIELV